MLNTQGALEVTQSPEPEAHVKSDWQLKLWIKKTKNLKQIKLIKKEG